MQRHSIKQKLTIKTIGKNYFWMGIILGVNYNLILLLFISYLREGFYLSILSYERDLVRLEPQDYVWIDLVIALLNTVISFGIIQIIWTAGLLKNNRNKKCRHKYYSIIGFVAFVTFTSYAVFYRVVSITTFYTISLEIHKLLLEYFDIRIFLFAPLAIFFTLWSKFQIYFKSYRWILISFVSIVGIGILLGTKFPINRDILSQNYNHIFDHEFNYIDKQLALYYDTNSQTYDEYRKVLRTKRSDEIYNLLMESRTKFHSLDSLSIDTLVLQKILIHNFNGGYFYCNPRWEQNCWYYAHPEDIKRLIKNAQLHSDKMELLFEILYEQLSYVLLFDDSLLFEEMNFTSRKKLIIYGLFDNRAPEILPVLLDIRNKLYHDPRYINYQKYLPDIEDKVNIIMKKQ